MENDVISSVWPEWSVVKQLGKGAYGVAYEAVRTDYTVESKAAIKVIKIPANDSEIESLRADGLSEDDTRSYLTGIVNDFVGEIQLMESLKGIQNIVSVEDYKVVEHKDRVGWTILIRMELLTPLNAFIGDDMLPEKAVLKLGVDICSALEICAMKKVIHRDIKPENIFIIMCAIQSILIVAVFAVAVGLPLQHLPEDCFEFTSEHILMNWGMLILMVVVYLIIARLVLSSVGKENG